MRILSYFFVFTWLSAPLAMAEDAWPILADARSMSEEDYIGEVPKVITVSRLVQSLADAPSAVTVIDRATIRASGAVDIPELFRLVPGMYVGTNAGFVHNTNHTVSYHGMTSAYSGEMQVLINGRSVYSPLYGGVNWSELPLAIADIERIEVTRGPNAASYGANSYFGVINIITQALTEVPSNTVIATHGNGRNEAFYRHAGKQNDFAYRLTVGYRQDDGLDNRNDFKRTRLLNAQADYKLNDRNHLEFEFGLADGARGEGNIDEDPFVFVPRTKQIANNYQLIRWRNNLGDDSDFLLQAYHNYDRSDDRTTSADLRTALPPAIAAFLAQNTINIKNEVVAERYDIEAQHNFALGKAIRAVWGGSIRRDSLYAPFYLGTKKTDYFDLQRLFGHVEWQAHQKVVVNAGAMIEHNDFTGTDISPRASINFKLNPDHTVRFGVSSALRTPTYLEERFQRAITAPTIIPNTSLLFQLDANKGNLNPEQIISREIGYLGKVGNLQLDARLFSDRISDVIRDGDRDDFIAPPNTFLLNPNDVRHNFNQGGAEVNGIEFQANWQLSRQTRLLVNHAYISIRETQAGLKRNYTRSAPRNTFSALLTHRLDQNWDASVAYYQTSKVTALGDGDPVDLARRTDVRLARQFSSKHFRGEFSAVIENLFNERYQEFADYNTLKRRARINLGLYF